MSKILVIGKYYYPFSGGIEENTRCIAEHAAKPHEVHVLVNAHDGREARETVNGVHVIRQKVHLTTKGQPISLTLFKDVALGDYDLIHFHSPNPFAAMVLSLRLMFRRRPKLVVTHHMDIYGRKLLRALTMPFQHFVMRRASSVIVTSAKNVTVSNDLPDRGHYEVVPLALDAEDYVRPEGAAPAMEWRRSICADAPAVGFIGRHARYKGLPIFMEALAKLPGVHAIIAGNGPYRATAEQRATELGIMDRVHFLGGIDHETKLNLLGSIDAFIFPSTETTEAFGISQMEAMLCGAPVVASNIPTGVTDVAIDGQTALLAEPGNAADLAEKIERILADRDLAARLAENGRNHILTNMTTSVVARRTVEIFERAIRSGTDAVAIETPLSPLTSLSRPAPAPKLHEDGP